MPASPTEREQPAFERVYFIGAGFSAGMGYPVGASLMPALVGYLRGEPAPNASKSATPNSVHASAEGRDHAEKVLAVVERVLGMYFATNLASIDTVDVAEFFSLAQSLAERSWLAPNASREQGYRPGINGEPSELTLFADLAAVTRTYFSDILCGCDDYPPDIYSILERVRPDRDVIINFNWDEEVDTFFSLGEDEDISYTLGAWRCAATPETLILKPHGSVGWYDIQRGIGNPNAYLIAMTDDRIPRYDKKIVSYMDNALPLDVGGETAHSVLACPPVITAPTFAKRFDYIEQQRIWQDVLEVCRNAQDFIFLGYSLPRDDFLTRAAIRAAISSRREGERLRCMAISRSFDNEKLLNFMSVFDGISSKRNFLPWKFGNDKGSLGDEVESKLHKASVGTG